MAVKRLDPKALHKIVSATDEALDLEKSDLKGYAETMDLSKLVFKEGLHPTFFLAKNVSAIDYVTLHDKHFIINPPTKEGGKAHVEIKDQGVMFIKYFELAVKQIEENGVVQDITMDMFPGSVIHEIGSYVMLLAEVGEARKKS